MSVSLSSAAQQGAAERVAQQVEKLRGVMVSPERDVLAELIADEVSYGHSSGKIEDKNAFIESLMSGASDFVTLDLSDQSISLAENVAVVRHKLSAKTNDRGKGPGTVSLGVLLVWLERDGTWQLVARQAYKI